MYNHEFFVIIVLTLRGRFGSLLGCPVWAMGVLGLQVATPWKLTSLEFIIC